MDSKMFFVIIYIAYLTIGSVINNVFVRDVVKRMILNDMASHPESFSCLDEDSTISVMQFIIGIIFELFWPIFIIMWTIKTIKMLISRKPK